jgi:hypothetical protein
LVVLFFGFPFGFFCFLVSLGLLYRWYDRACIDDEIWQRYSGLREDGVPRAKYNQSDLVPLAPPTETEQIDLLLVQMADKVALAGKAKLVSKVPAGSASATDSALAARLNALHASSSQQGSSSAHISPVEDRRMADVNDEDEDEETLIRRIIAQVKEDIALEQKHGVDLGEHPHDQHSMPYASTQSGESGRSDDSESSSGDSNFSDLEELLDFIDDS